MKSSDCFKYLCLFSIAKLASLLEIVTHWYQNKTEVRFAVPLPQALVEVSVSLSRVKMCLARSEGCSAVG